MEEKFNSIDLFKFMMVIVVIAIHTNPFAQCSNILINNIAIVIEDMANPFFFMVSGYLLAVRWGYTRQQREKYVRKMLLSTVRLYVTWTLISLPLTIYGYVISGNSIISCIISYMKYFFFVGKLYNSYHLWYLLAMIYALALMYVLIHNDRGIKHILITGIFLYTMCSLFLWLRQSDQVNGLLATAGRMFYFVFNSGGVFTGMLFMSIGMCIREYCKIGPLGSVIGIAVGVLVRYGLSQELGNMLSSAMLFILAINIRLSDRSYYITLRKLSKYIYLSHLLCFSFYTFIIIKQPNKLGVGSFLATTVLSIAISTVIIHWNDLWKTREKKGSVRVL